MDIQLREQLLNSAEKVHTRTTYYGDANIVPLLALNLIYELLADCKLILEFDCKRKLQMMAEELIRCSPDICNLRDDSVFLQENLDRLTILVEASSDVNAKNTSIYFGNGLKTFTFQSSYFTSVTTEEVSLVQIVSLPAQGTLTFDGTAVEPGLIFNVSDSDKLIYERVDNPYQDTFLFKVSNNETDKTFSNMATFTINVDGQINLPPTIGDGAETTSYATTIVFTRAMFTTGTTPPYSDPEGDAEATLKITSLPATGEIQLDGVAININDTFDFTTVIDAGRLTYVPDAGTTTSYVDPFTFEIADAGSGEFAP